jgi:CheY-like chemotaxis protein
MPTESSTGGSRAGPTEPKSLDTTEKSVLIVEDDEELAELLAVWTRAFCGRDARIHTAHSVADGRAQLESQSGFDIALLDRRLPDGPGREVLETIPNGSDVNTLMITAVAPDSDIIDLPITDYLVKPIDEETLVERLSLVDKLETVDALEAYTASRKASLLEYHLDTPEENPVFKRFAARWSYDRLEIAVLDEHAVVYELYIGETNTVGEGELHVSIAGTLDPGIESLFEAGAIEPIGELLPSGDDYAWVEADSSKPIDPDDGTVGIYGFTCETPERYVADGGWRDGPSDIELTAVLESAFS